MKSGIIVQGEGKEVTSIDGGATDSVIYAYLVDDTAEIDGFTITNGSAKEGGGICFHSSDLTVSNCKFTNNSATYGGGMYVDAHSSPQVMNCIFDSNVAGYGGGLDSEYHTCPK